MNEISPVLIMLAVGLAVSSAVMLTPVRRQRLGSMACLACGLALGVLAAHGVLPGQPLLPSVVVSVLLIGLASVYLRSDLVPGGAVLWLAWLGFTIVGTGWTVLFVTQLRLSALTTALIWTGIGLAALTLPSALVTTREGWEPLLRSRWRRPRTALTAPPARRPWISIHVPCHAEPPAVVIATLNRLAALDYPNLEVLVIDNNTTEESLWLPVRDHCLDLGPRFRFLHVEGLTGAKAGALNWALKRTDPRAEVIGVIDADYQVSPNWLEATVGYFGDPAIGFVQCPHAYRDFAHSRFGRWAASEYAVFFAAGMVSLNEHNAGLTVGTMSLIRREALETAGGWAEWCLTEDSELAIRIHACGYHSVYLAEPLGRGLIPETFAGYRAQRFRWTFGPVQEFRRHWRLFLPRRLGATPTRLTRRQKLHHANHGIDVVSVGVRALASVVAIAAGVSMLAHGERVAVPVELWAASTAVLVSSLIVRYLVYTRVVGASLTQAIGGTLAFAALRLIIATASLRASAGHSIHWRRTHKFPSRRAGLGALRQVRAEAMLGTAALLTGVLLLTLAPLGGVTTMMAIAALLQAVALFSAVSLSIVADRALPTRIAKHAAVPATAFGLPEAQSVR